MPDFTILQGCCTIQLYRKVSGNNRYPHTIVWEVCGNTLVDECNFQTLDQHTWRMVWNNCTQSYYARRSKRLPKGKTLNIFMARDVLGLPQGVGHNGGMSDHEKHDTLDNTLDNLRVATQSQNTANSRNIRTFRGFKGVYPSGSGFRAAIQYKNWNTCFPVLRLETEAAIMYNYAAQTLFGEFAHLNEIFEDETPSEERLEWLWQLVFKKLREVGLLAEE